MSKLFNDMKKEYLNEKIPNDINNNISNLLNNLPTNKNKVFRNRYIKAASIVLIFSVSIFLLSLSYQPIRASMISLFKQFKNSNIVIDNINKYSEETNEIIEVNNKYITINEIIYSPKDITFTYTVDPSFFGENINSNIIEKLLSMDLYYGLPINKFSLNNKDIIPIEVNGTSKLSENGDKIIGYQNIIFDDIKDGDNISIDINNLGLSTEKATVNLKVDMKMTNNDIFVLKDPIVKQNERATVSVEKFIRTPLITYIVYTLELKEDLKDTNTLNAYIVNEFGRDLYGNTGYDEKREDISPTKVRISRYLRNTAEGINEINIIPTIKKNSKESSKMFIDINTPLPYIIDLLPFGTVKINSVNKTENKLSLDCTVDGINKDILIGNINIAPTIMEEKLQNPDLLLNFNPLWMDSESYERINNLDDINNISISFDTTGLEEPLSIFYYKSLLQEEILNDVSIKVKVN